MHAWVRTAVAAAALLLVLPHMASASASGSEVEVTVETNVSYEADVTAMVAAVSSPWLKKCICLLYEFLCKGDKVVCKSFTVFGTILVIMEVFLQLVFACISKNAIFVGVAEEVAGLVTKCKALAWCKAQYDAFFIILYNWIPCLKGVLKLGLVSALLTGVNKAVTKAIPPSSPGLLGAVSSLVKKLV